MNDPTPTRLIPPFVHRLMRRADRAVCRAIAIECLGGEAYYAIRAGATLTVLLLAAAGVGARLAIRQIARRR